MYREEAREGMGADGIYHDYDGGYLPEFVQTHRALLEAQEGLQLEPVVVFSRVEEVVAQSKPPANTNQ